MTQKRSFLLGIAASLFFAAGLLDGGYSVAAQVEDGDRSIVIGASVSLSGPAAEQGRNWLDGAMLAAEELQAEGRKVTLKVEDDQTVPARVPGIIRKLVSFDGAQAIIGGTWDFLSEAAHPVVRELKVPFVTPSNPPEIVDRTAGRNPYVFTNGLSLAATELAMRSFLSKHKPASAAIIVPNVTFGVVHGDMVEKIASELGIRITSRHNLEYAGWHETLRALAASLSRVEKPELVFCLSDYSGIDVLASQLETFKYFPLLLTTQHLDQAIELSKRPERYQRAYGIYPLIADKGFEGRFSARFGHAPKVYAANGYDALKFLAAALQAVADLSEPGFGFRGILGDYLVSEKTRGLLNRDEAVIMGLRDGRLSEIRH